MDAAAECAVTLRHPAAAHCHVVSSVTGFISLRLPLARVAAIIRRIIGAPDYDVYLAHMQRCHPDRAPLSKAEFERDRLDARYSRPGSRCC